MFCYYDYVLFISYEETDDINFNISAYNYQTKCFNQNLELNIIVQKCKQSEKYMLPYYISLTKLITGQQLQSIPIGTGLNHL